MIPAGNGWFRKLIIHMTEPGVCIGKTFEGVKIPKKGMRRSK